MVYLPHKQAFSTLCTGFLRVSQTLKGSNFLTNVNFDKLFSPLERVEIVEQCSLSYDILCGILTACMNIFYPVHDYLTEKKGVCLHSILGSHLVVSRGTAEMSDNWPFGVHKNYPGAYYSTLWSLFSDISNGNPHMSYIM